jgi:stage III sporulation protein AD
MEIFSKAVSIALISVVLCLFVSKRDKEIATLLSLLTCCMLLIVAVRYLEPILQFIEQLKSMGNMHEELIAILMQAVSIGLLSQIMGSVCSDAGYAAIAKTLQLLATVVMLFISLPAFRSLLDLLEGILSAL